MTVVDTRGKEDPVSRHQVTPFEHAPGNNGSHSSNTTTWLPGLDHNGPQPRPDELGVYCLSAKLIGTTHHHNPHQPTTEGRGCRAPGTCPTHPSRLGRDFGSQARDEVRLTPDTRHQAPSSADFGLAHRHHTPSQRKHRTNDPRDKDFVPLGRARRTFLGLG